MNFFSKNFFPHLRKKDFQYAKSSDNASSLQVLERFEAHKDFTLINGTGRFTNYCKKRGNLIPKPITESDSPIQWLHFDI